MALSALYNALFGKKSPTDGSVIDLAEHGRVGGISTGQPFKFVSNIDGTIPTDGNNPSLTITESIDGTVTTTTLTKVISGVSYQKTIAEDSSDGSTTISSWSII